MHLLGYCVERLAAMYKRGNRTWDKQQDQCVLQNKHFKFLHFIYFFK